MVSWGVTGNVLRRPNTWSPKRSSVALKGFLNKTVEPNGPSPRRSVRSTGSYGDALRFGVIKTKSC